MTAYWHYCDHCGRNAPEKKPIIRERKRSHYTPSSGDSSGYSTTVWVSLCPDCNEPLTCRVEYCELHDLQAGARGSRGFVSHLLMCPYCGKWQRNPGFSLDEGLTGTTKQCVSCDNEFEVTATYDVTWYTKRREGAR